MKFAVSALALAATIWIAQENPGDIEQDSFNAPGLDAAIALLESESFKDFVVLEGGSELATELRRFLTSRFEGERGFSFRKRALDQIESGRPEQRRKAMLLLSQCKDVTAYELEVMRSSPSPLAVAWASLHPGADSERLPVEADTTLFSVGMGQGVDPIAACAPQIAAQLRLTPSDLEGLKQEYIDGYNSVLIPNLEKLTTFVSAEKRYWLDTDGDGKDEVYARITIPDGWDWVTISVRLDQDEVGDWSLVWFDVYGQGDRRDYFNGADFLVVDLDGDKLPEVVESMHGVQRYSKSISVRGLHLNGLFHGSKASLIKSPWGGSPLFIEGEPYNLTGHSNALDYATRLGTELTLTEIGPMGERIESVVIVPRD
jgi:hypothetical protein